jgi:hypothetical protein
MCVCTCGDAHIGKLQTAAAGAGVQDRAQRRAGGAGNAICGALRGTPRRQRPRQPAARRALLRSAPAVLLSRSRIQTTLRSRRSVMRKKDLDLGNIRCEMFRCDPVTVRVLFLFVTDSKNFGALATHPTRRRRARLRRARKGVRGCRGCEKHTPHLRTLHQGLTATQKRRSMAAAATLSTHPHACTRARREPRAP